MSAVSLEKICRQGGNLQLHLSGIDLLDRTPVLDVKPYLPYADSIPQAQGGFAATPPQSSLTVQFTDHSRQTCAMLAQTYPGLADLIVQVLSADPRPAYMRKSSSRTEFGMRLYDLNIRWSVRPNAIVVQEIQTGLIGSESTAGTKAPDQEP
jgi:hypothetical protein